LVLVQELIFKISLEDKIKLLSGEDFWSTYALPSIGLRKMVLSDGPSGVRGSIWDERLPSLSLPSATCISASWNLDLVKKMGEISALEAIRKGVDIVLGPTINLQRSPLGGRHFECYSEDPYLSGVVASAFVSGVQSHGVGACLKHFVANDTENERFTYDAQVDDQVLNELYLAPFEIAIKTSNPWMIMSSYNSTNGHFMSESPLLEDPLKSAWGFSGVVVSDWTAVRSVVASANAAQDLAMPGPDSVWANGLLEAVNAGLVSEKVIDEKILRVLGLATRVKAIGPHQLRNKNVAPDPSHRDEIRKAASSGFVLVRNSGVLPMNKKLGKLAVLGSHALVGRIMGGGSASVVAISPVSPIQGIIKAMPETEIKFAHGTYSNDELVQLPIEQCSLANGSLGVLVTYFDNDDSEILSEIRFAGKYVKMDGELRSKAKRVVATTRFTADLSGVHRFGGGGTGKFAIYFNDKLHTFGETVFDPEDLLGALVAPPQMHAEVSLAKGELVEIKVEYFPSDQLDWNVLSMFFGFRSPRLTDEEEFNKAIKIAEEADVVVVIVGTTDSLESEGYDRKNLKLPSNQDDLVNAVLSVNPRTIVVVNSGGPVEMPWIEKTAATLLSWFPGEEFGNALADVLIGDIEPGGRMPTTWPKQIADAVVNSTDPISGTLSYTEGLNIGYRGFHSSNVEPMFWLGYGLGYTTWKIQSINLNNIVESNSECEIEVQVTNTGKRSGSHVVQAYLSCVNSTVDRPALWLAGFTRVSAGPGETVRAKITIDGSRFKHWAHEWRSELIEFDLSIASDSSLRDALTHKIQIVEKK